MRPIHRRLMVLLVAAFSGGLTWTRADDTPPAAGRRADQAALKPYGGLVGGWRHGVGQVERGRTKGASSEDADWAWKLTPDSAALEGKITKGKYLKSLVIRPDKEPHTFVAETVLADDTTPTLTGKGGIITHIAQNTAITRNVPFVALHTSNEASPSRG
jgi:hypothetical protein